MEIYLIKSVACLAIFFTFYKLVLERESFHHLKRFYLLLSVIGSITIPLITFTTYISVPQFVTPMVTQEYTSVISSETEVATNYLPTILWSLYVLGVLFFSTQFFRNLYSIIHKIKTNPHYKAANFFHVLISSAITPHTFFSYIFLNKQKFEANEIPSEVIIHEHAHAHQMHSLDILLIELAQIVFWFNPIIYLVKRSIKLNHEFLADQEVLNSGATTSEYQKILLAFSSNAAVPSMANSINYSSIKKRFTVMKTQTSQRKKWLRSFLLLPLLAVIIYGFSSTKVVEVPQNVDKTKNKDNYTTQYLEGAKRNNTKAFVLMITVDEITLNGKQVSLENLANELDAYTKGWEETDYTSAKPSMLIASSTEEFLNKVDAEFRKTHYSKANEGTGIRTKLASNSFSQASATREEMKEYNKLAKKYNNMSKDNMFIKKEEIERLKFIYGKMSDKQRADAEPFPNIPPPPPPPPAPDAQKVIKGVNDMEPNNPPPPPPAPDAPKVVKGVNDMEPNIPPPPPAPESPLDHIISMAKKGASFYYEGDKITSDKAIALLKNNKNLNIQTTRVNSSNPRVEISTQPITVDKPTPMAVSIVDMPFEGPTRDLSDPITMIDYMIQHGAKLYFEGKVISEEKGKEIIKGEKSVRLINVETPHDVPSVIIGSEYGC